MVGTTGGPNIELASRRSRIHNGYHYMDLIVVSGCFVQLPEEKTCALDLSSSASYFTFSAGK